MILLNDEEIGFTKFPNGEMKIEDSINDYISVYNLNSIVFKFEDDSDFIKLMMIKRHLETMGVQITKLLITYMPYSRMDRSENNSVFTLKYIADFINSLNFSLVTVLEPHSDVTPALLNNCETCYINFDLIDKVMYEVKFDNEKDFLFFPDAGAQKRYSKMEAKNQLVGYKKRNWDTGKIESLDLVGELPEKPFKAIIVDDLSSFGGTFIMSANKLKAAGATHVYLLVAHAEDSVFKGNLLKGGNVDKVFTTDSMMDLREGEFEELEEIYSDYIKIYKLEEVI